ncbi:MAG: flagellar export protein FliJ [Hyphomicrobiales bacterium]
MRSRDTLIRLQQFKVEERQRDVADIEMMIADFMQKETELQQQIHAEEERAGVSDVNHYNYPTTAKAISDRRENLLRSVDELKAKLDEAIEACEEEQSELRKLELLVEKDDDLKASSKNEEEQVVANPMAATH